MATQAGKLIESSLKKSGLWENAVRHMAPAVWAEVTGQRISQHAEAVGMLGAALVVRVENPSWRQQLHMMRLELIEKINKRLGGNYVEDLRFTTRRLLSADMPEVRKNAFAGWPGATAVRGLPVDAREEKDIDQTLLAVPDQKLRAACRKLALTLVRRQRLLQQQGLKKCKLCGSLTTEVICSQCIREMSTDRQQRAIGILSRLPWLDAEGLRGVDPELGNGEYRVAVETLTATWIKEAFSISASRSKKSITRLRLCLANLAMVLTHTPPEKLTDGIISGSVPPRLARQAGLAAQGGATV